MFMLALLLVSAVLASTFTAMAWQVVSYLFLSGDRKVSRTGSNLLDFTSSCTCSSLRSSPARPPLTVRRPISQVRRSVGPIWNAAVARAVALRGAGFRATATARLSHLANHVRKTQLGRAAARSAVAAAAPVTPVATADYGLTPGQIAAWDQVNLCEEGGNWHVEGSTFAGGLGISRANWSQFNTFGFPADEGVATPDQQIRVAVAFATHYFGSPYAAPDQGGCHGGY